MQLATAQCTVETNTTTDFNNLELYNKYIHRAKHLLETIKSYQIEIVKMVLEVCDIRHGGISHDVFTIKRFALDIGMNPKTLQNWVREYKNVALKLTLEEQNNLKSAEDWKKIRQVNKIVDRNAPKEEVRKIFRTDYEPSFLIEINNFIASQKHLKYCLNKRDMSLVSIDTWMNLMNLLDYNSDEINKFLTRISKLNNNREALQQMT